MNFHNRAISPSVVAPDGSAMQACSVILKSYWSYFTLLSTYLFVKYLMNLEHIHLAKKY